MGKQRSEKLSYFPEDAEPGSQPILYQLRCKTVRLSQLHRMAGAQGPLDDGWGSDNSPPMAAPHSWDPLSVLRTACARQGNGLCLS